jgi:outer membrane protein assembly factor BamB
MQLLPQLLPFLAAGVAGLFSSRAWRERFGRWVRWLGTARGMAFGCVLVGLLAGAAVLIRPANRSRVVAAPPSAPAKAADWPMFRGNLARTGGVAPAGEPVQNTMLWSFSDPDARLADLSSSPAVVGSRVYVASAQASVFDTSGMVYCLDGNTGKRVWQFQTMKQGFSSPAVVKGRVYVGEGLHFDTGCALYCLDAATGNQLWATKTKSHTEGSPAVVGNRLYAGAGDDGIYCLDTAGGKVIWHRPGMHSDASPAVANGRVYLGTGYGKLRAMALNAATGATVWETPCDLAVWGPPAVVDGKVYFGIGNGDFGKSAANPMGGVWCLDAATGKPLWRRNLPDAVITAVLVAGGRAVAGCRDGRVYALEAATGNPVWSASGGGPVVASPAADARCVYAVGANGGLTALDWETGKPVWVQDLAVHTAPDVQVYSSPALAGGRLYLGTNRGKLFCVGR